MARIGSTGVLELWYAPTISDKASPTVAEVTTAGEDLTGFLLRDGLSTPKSGSTIDVAGVDSRYNSTARGSFGGDPIQVTFFRDDTTDTAWDTLTDTTDGYLVIFRFAPATAGAPAASDKCEVWPIEVISREPQPIADNQAQRFTVTCAVPTPPELDATIAA